MHRTALHLQHVPPHNAAGPLLEHAAAAAGVVQCAGVQCAPRLRSSVASVMYLMHQCLASQLVLPSLAVAARYQHALDIEAAPGSLEEAWKQDLP